MVTRARKQMARAQITQALLHGRFYERLDTGIVDPGSLIFAAILRVFKNALASAGAAGRVRRTAMGGQESQTQHLKREACSSMKHESA
jgi:hypothetical protein